MGLFLGNVWMFKGEKETRRENLTTKKKKKIECSGHRELLDSQSICYLKI
jgi:hypothetical protein